MIRHLQDIEEHSDHLIFCEGDGVPIIEIMSNLKDVRLFIDPPYTALGGKQSDNCLYSHNAIDHKRIFHMLSNSDADFLMTYDQSEEVLDLIADSNFSVSVEMKKQASYANI